MFPYLPLITSEYRTEIRQGGDCLWFTFTEKNPIVGDGGQYRHLQISVPFDYNSDYGITWHGHFKERLNKYVTYESIDNTPIWFQYLYKCALAEREFQIEKKLITESINNERERRMKEIWKEFDENLTNYQGSLQDYFEVIETFEKASNEKHISHFNQ